MTDIQSHAHRCPHCPFTDDSLVRLSLHLRDEHLIPRLRSTSPSSDPSATSSTASPPADAAAS